MDEQKPVLELQDVEFKWLYYAELHSIMTA